MKGKKSNFVPKQRQAPVHTTPLEFSLYNYHYCIVDCAFTLQEFIETLECILLFPYHPWTYCGGSSLVVLFLADRTTVEVEWQVPLVRLGPFIPWFRDQND
jgi:hypothetical protein